MGTAVSRQTPAELDLMLDRFDRGLMANAFITLDPNNKRFPCEVVGTGRVVPQGIELTTSKIGISDPAV